MFFIRVWRPTRLQATRKFILLPAIYIKNFNIENQQFNVIHFQLSLGQSTQNTPKLSLLKSSPNPPFYYHFEVLQVFKIFLKFVTLKLFITQNLTIMASTSETGLAKMVGNFNSLISFAIGWEGKYVPSQKALAVANLQTVHQNAVAVLKEVKTLKSTFDIAVNKRQLAYEPVKSLSTRVVNALASSEADKKIIADAKTINRKVQGTRAPKAAPPPDENGETPEQSDKTISAAQLSFDSLQDNFEKLVELVKQEDNYKPNEKELQVVTLDNYLATLVSTNKNVIDATAPVSNKRIERDSILYDEPGGLVPLALKVKTYAKSAFKPTSPQYKQVTKLQFRNRKK